MSSPSTITVRSSVVPVVRAKDFTQHKAHCNSPPYEKDRVRNRNKYRIRATGEQPLLILKKIFAFTKVRYHGLRKNANRLLVACGLVNLYRCDDD
jgi:transposase, IS5 family